MIKLWAVVTDKDMSPEHSCPKEPYPGRLASQAEGNGWQQVEHLVRLLKKGDTASLTQLRHQLGRTQRELALKIGVSPRQLSWWEKGEQQPSGIYHALWKVKLSYYVDDAICDLLGTEDKEVVTRFWKLVWGLVD